MAWDRYKPRGAEHGWTHTQARKQWAAHHRDTDLCVRCGHTLGPMGAWLHLDHHDWDKRVYLGFSHGSCNLRAAGQLGNSVQHTARHSGSAGSTTYRL